MHVASLHIHPVKSCAAVAVDRLAFGPLGPVDDRVWMVVEPDGAMVTARRDPVLATVAVRRFGEALVVAHGTRTVAVPWAVEGLRREVTVWEHSGPGIDAGEDAAAFFSTVVGRPVRLVRRADDHGRRTDPDWTPDPVPVGFADGFPVLVLSTASLDGLNERLDAPVPMARFRPNVVIAGTSAHDEDRWTAIRVGDIVLTWVKPCARCSMTTVDPATGRAMGPEPLRTLATYRKGAKGVTFGANHVATEGVVRVGDPVEVLGWRADDGSMG